MFDTFNEERGDLFIDYFGYAILQQSVDVVVKYKRNVFAYVEGKIEASDCQ